MSTRAMRLGRDRASSAARLSITAAMVIAQSDNLRNYLQFSASADLCKEMSTKSNDNALRTGAARGVAVSSSGAFWRGVARRLAWARGVAPMRARRRGGAGAILRFEQVRRARRDAFQPRRAHEITPEFLDRAIRAMKRWKLDFVSIDE